MHKLKVFVSSTYEDMKMERDVVFQTLLKNGEIIGGMEFFSGDNIDIFNTIKNDIEDSDVFLLIMGGRYGTICRETGKSFVHMEYEHAKSLGIPVGVIAISDSYLSEKKKAAYSKRKTYYNEGAERYDNFLSIVSKKMVDHYSNNKELAVNVLTTLKRIRETYNPQGWIRCNENSIRNHLSNCTADDIIRLTGCSLVKELDTTEKDHYRLSQRLLLEDGSDTKIKRAKSIFLMQRSSSIILGAESGWRAEKNFLSTLLSAINKCDRFYHLVTIDGIISHLKRKNSSFPDFSKYYHSLRNVNGNCAVKKDNDPSGGTIIKKLPAEEATPLFKLDRQVGALLVENTDSSVEALFVWNIGTEESCMHVKGPEMVAYLEKLISYFHECENLLWSDMEKIKESLITTFS